MAKVSKYGQWKYPGEDTIIPSGDITMQGVPYPVFGIDNLGNTKMMQPGGDYKFPGSSVYEIPMMGYGGDISIPNLKRVRIKSLPKAQTVGELKEQALQREWNRQQVKAWDPNQLNGAQEVPTDNVVVKPMTIGLPPKNAPKKTKDQIAKEAAQKTNKKAQNDPTAWLAEHPDYVIGPDGNPIKRSMLEQADPEQLKKLDIQQAKEEFVKDLNSDPLQQSLGAASLDNPVTNAAAERYADYKVNNVDPGKAEDQMFRGYMAPTTRDFYQPNNASNTVRGAAALGTTAAGVAGLSAGLAYLPALGEAAYAWGSANPFLQATSAGLNASRLGIPGLSISNLINAGFATHGLKTIVTGEAIEPWKHAFDTGDPLDYLSAAGQNLMTGLEILPVAGPLIKTGVEATRPAFSAAGEFLTTQTPLRNTWKFNPAANTLGEYNRVVGSDAIADIAETGLIRSGEGAVTTMNGIPVSRPTAWPSFAKGDPKQTYINGVLQRGDTPYIISTDRPMAVSTLGRHGKGSTQFPVGPDGSYLTSFPASEATVYEQTPHWLTGYKPVETSKLLPGSPNSHQYQIRGLAGTSTKTGLTEENVAAAVEREKQWIQSDEYIRRRAANTGETVEQIKADVAKILSTAENARFNLNANITAQGQMTPKSLFQRAPTVEISKAANNPLNTLEHETAHLYSPTVHGQSDAALHKGMLEADVASLPTSERGVYANYPTLGEGFDKTANTINLGSQENYLKLGQEQQVRHLNARADILKANNLPLEAELTEAEVKPFVDAWAERMNKLAKDPQNPDLIKTEMDYDEIWLDEAWKIRENLLKEYGVAADSELSAAQTLEYKQRTKEELTKAITDVLNKAWIAVPAIGVGAAMQQKKRGGAINAISKYKNKFASKVNNDLPVAQDLGTFKRKPLTQTKLNIPAEFQNNTRLDAWVGMPQQSGLGDFTTHRVPSVYDAVKSGSLGSMEEAVNKYLGYPQERAINLSEQMGNPGEDPIDNVRHSTAAMYTQQAIKDKIGIPIVGDALGFLGANAMGIGHELGTIFRDERPWDVKLRESAEDELNNFAGSFIGLLPGTQEEKGRALYNLSAGNWLADGVVDPNGQNNLYFKNEQGNAPRWSPQEMYNNMFSKKQGGLQKAKTKKDKGFQILTDANGKYVFVKT